MKSPETRFKATLYGTLKFDEPLKSILPGPVGTISVLVVLNGVRGVNTPPVFVILELLLLPSFRKLYVSVTFNNRDVFAILGIKVFVIGEKFETYSTLPLTICTLVM